MNIRKFTKWIEISVNIRNFTRWIEIGVNIQNFTKLIEIGVDIRNFTKWIGISLIRNNSNHSKYRLSCVLSFPQCGNLQQPYFKNVWSCIH